MPGSADVVDQDADSAPTTNQAIKNGGRDEDEEKT
jgi:hypothetical protein